MLRMVGSFMTSVIDEGRIVVIRTRLAVTVGSIVLAAGSFSTSAASAGAAPAASPGPRIGTQYGASATGSAAAEVGTFITNADRPHHSKTAGDV